MTLIADCPTIEELYLDLNVRVTNKSAQTLARLPNLKILGVDDTGMKWRAMIEFKKNPQLIVSHTFRFEDVRNSELEVMAEINNTTDELDISGCDETTIPRATELFPELRSMVVDSFKSLNPSNIEQLKSHSNLKLVELQMQQESPGKTWWQSLLTQHDAYDLGNNSKTGHARDEFSIWFTLKDHVPDDPVLNIYGISPEELTQLNEIGGLSTIWSCSFFDLSIPEFKNFGFLSWLSGLERLSLHSCGTTEQIDFGSLSPTLKTIRLKNCEQLAEIVNLVDFPELSGVYIDGCPTTTIRNIDLPSSWLLISSPTKQDLVSLDILKDVRSLGELHLIDCVSLKDLDGIENIAGLQTLKMSLCSSVRDWSALFKCRELRDLRFRMKEGRAEKLPPPDLDFLAKLDNFSFSERSKSVNQTWIDAWDKIVAARVTAAGD